MSEVDRNGLKAIRASVKESGVVDVAKATAYVIEAVESDEITIEGADTFLAKSASKNPELWVKAAGAEHDDAAPKGGSRNPWSPAYRGGDAEAERIRVIRTMGTKAAQTMAKSCNVDIAGRALAR